MVATAVIGCSGYAGQETLDRVLAHPELELVALGSDSLAGSGASALDVRLNGSLPAVRDERRGARERRRARLPLPRPRRGGRRRAAGRMRSSSTSPGAHRLVDAAQATEWYGVAPGAWSYGLPELYPPAGPLIANPGCYATAALLALAPLAGGDRPGRRRRRREVGRLRRRPHAEAGLARRLRARELRRPTRSARTGTRPRSRSSSASRSASCPHLLPVRRGLLATCYVRSDEDVRALLEAAYATSPVVRVLPGGRRRRSSRASRARTRPRSASSRTRRPARRSSSARSTTSARAPRARRSRTRTSSLGLDETLGRLAASSRECLPY